MEKTIETERIIRSLKALIANSIINEYAVERVAFGFEKPGDKAPIDLYLQDSHLSINDFPSRQDIPGVYIDEQERISAEQDYAEYVRDLFVMKAERIFSDAPKDVCLERDGEEIPMLPRFRKYLFGLLPLFTEVLNVEVKCDAFDIIVTEKESDAEYPLWQKFVTAILLEPIKSGSQINRYVKNISNAPNYIGKLIEKKDGNFYLKPVDIYGYEYAFALFSLVQFVNDANGRLLELKMLEWERKRLTK